MTPRVAITTTQAAAKATEAAETLMAWLHAQPGGGERIATAVSSSAEHPAAKADADVVRSDAASMIVPAVPPQPAHRPAEASLPPAVGTSRHAPNAPLRLAHTDWLHHRLQITGPAFDLAAFQAAAAGAGTIPWQIDFDRAEEDLFHFLVARTARSLSLTGARILAGQLRAAAARRHALSLPRVGHSRACPFDLHALVPVPDTMLRRGPDDPEALAWLWANWGTTETLRHVIEDNAAAAVLHGRTARGEAIWLLTFWSADWTPWRALAKIAAGWPALRFDTRPSYDAL